MTRSFKLPWKKRFGMHLRQSPVSQIIDAMNKCNWYDIQINEDQLEAHHLTGGSIKELVDGLVFMKVNGMKISNDMLSIRQVLISVPLTEHLQKYLDMDITDLTEDNLLLDFPDDSKLPHTP